MRRLLLLGTALLLGLAGGAGAGVARTAADPATLHEALAVSKRLGPVPPNTTVDLQLALRLRNAKALQQLLLTGGGTGAGSFAKKYGPDPALVRPALAAVRGAGLRATWAPGDGTASLEGSAATVERVFHVRLFRYVTPGGREFYAADRSPTVPGALKKVIDGIAGFDDYAQLTPAAIRPGGVTPTDVISFYDIAPLRAAGLDGSGVTVVFPELNSLASIPQLRKDVARFSRQNGLPPADLTIRTEPAWGAIQKASGYDLGLGEADLDVEIVHSIAPKAKLVVYEEAPDFTSVAAETAMVQENPTAIISDSTAECELALPTSSAIRVAQAPWIQQAAQNMTHYDASGDLGAFMCGEQYKPAVGFPDDLPVVTAVGGTSVFMAQGGGYYREVAWGNALSQSGSGGGATLFYKRPAYQSGPSFPSLRSAPGRVLPDVSGLADENTGWSIVILGKSIVTGGTSATAPLWAGITALIDQDLKRHGLRQVGLANPALYWIGAHNARFHAFHDVTAGNNLFYPAGPGWDQATGWGSPDAAKLDVAWRAYIAQGGK